MQSAGEYLHYNVCDHTYNYVCCFFVEWHCIFCCVFVDVERHQRFGVTIEAQNGGEASWLGCTVMVGGWRI